MQFNKRNLLIAIEGTLQQVIVTINSFIRFRQIKRY
jgi:hypothetical protein